MALHFKWYGMCPKHEDENPCHMATLIWRNYVFLTDLMYIFCFAFVTRYSQNCHDCGVINKFSRCSKQFQKKLKTRIFTVRRRFRCRLSTSGCSWPTMRWIPWPAACTWPDRTSSPEEPWTCSLVFEPGNILCQRPRPWCIAFLGRCWAKGREEQPNRSAKNGRVNFLRCRSCNC